MTGEIVVIFVLLFIVQFLCHSKKVKVKTVEDL